MKLIEDMARAMMDADKDAFGYDELAKAALAVVLQSLRDPSEQMLHNGGIQGGFDAYRGDDNTADVWRVMLTQWAKEQGVER